MDNMVQAIKMAFGIIITVLLISAIMFMYNKFKVLPEQKAIADEQAFKNDFNAQFEVFNKKQMYGTDVISALNLIYSNNTRAGDWNNGNSYLGLKTDGVKERSVKVNVELKKGLQSEVLGYYFQNRVQREVEIGGASKEAQSNITLSGLSQNGNLSEKLLKLVGEVLNIDTNTNVTNLIKEYPFSYTGIMQGNNLVLNEKTFKRFSGFISLLGNQQIEIKNERAKKDSTVGASGFNNLNNNWTRIIIKTPGADLKKRIFTCREIKYSDNGMISEINYKEIDYRVRRKNMSSNMARALLMAGGVLMGILVMSLLVYWFNLLGQYQKGTEEADYRHRQVLEFNDKILMADGGSAELNQFDESGDTKKRTNKDFGSRSTIGDLISAISYIYDTNKKYEGVGFDITAIISGDDIGTVTIKNTISKKEMSNQMYTLLQKLTILNQANDNDKTLKRYVVTIDRSQGNIQYTEEGRINKVTYRVKAINLENGNE